MDSDTDRASGAVVRRRRRWGRMVFWAVLILLGPGIWVASYWHEFFFDASALESRWLCMTIGSGRLTLSYNDDDMPPMHLTATAINPYVLREAMFIVRGAHMRKLRADAQKFRSALEQRLAAEGSTEETTQAIRVRLDKLEEYLADQEKENAAYLAEQRMQASHLLNDELRSELWYYESTTVRSVEFIVHVHLIVPLGLFCVFAILVRGIVRRARARRKQEGLCESCGYNLTGNTSGVCPECGTPVPETTSIPEAAPAKEA